MKILPNPGSLWIPTSTSTSKTHFLSSHGVISPVSLLPGLSSLSLSQKRPPSTVIRMGGGPRTYPGGVSKWQWKRMQAKKSKQLLKARLARERQIYEMRKRAELKAAVSDLERPWELVDKATSSSSNLFSVSADDQLKVLADRFQKPGGFDMWTENDGPQIFVTPDQGLPTARFFPKGVVHSIRPYGRLDKGDVGDLSGDESSDFEESVSEYSWVGARENHDRRNGTMRVGVRENHDGNLLDSDSEHSQDSTSKPYYNGEHRSVQRRGKYRSGGVYKVDGEQKRLRAGNDNGKKLMESRQGGHALRGGKTSSRTKGDSDKWFRRENLGRSRNLQSEDVYDMSLQGDGNYCFIGGDQDGR